MINVEKKLARQRILHLYNQCNLCSKKRIRQIRLICGSFFIGVSTCADAGRVAPTNL